MKYLLAILSVITLFSCKHKETEPKLLLHEFVFSVTGFNPKSFDTATFNDVFPDSYLDIDTNGNCRIFERLSKPEKNSNTDTIIKLYTKTRINNYLIKQLNDNFTGRYKYNTQYYSDVNPEYIGPYYTIVYTTPQKERNIILFSEKGMMPLPTYLIKQSLDSITSDLKIDTIKPFSISGYTNFVKQYIIKSKSPLLTSTSPFR